LFKKDVKESLNGKSTPLTPEEASKRIIKTIGTTKSIVKPVNPPIIDDDDEFIDDDDDDEDEEDEEDEVKPTKKRNNG